MSKKVLIIDDDDALLESMELILEEFGYQVQAYPDATMIHCLNEDCADVILLDYQLADITGDEIAQILRNKPETKNIPIIMISAYHDLRGIYKKIGADAFIPKPFDIDDLVNKVEHYASNSNKSVN